MTQTTALTRPGHTRREQTAGGQALRVRFDELVRSTAERLKWYCLRLCSDPDDSADDLCQEVLLKAWRQFATFETRYPGGFYMWTRVIALHTYRSALKKRRPSSMHVSIEEHKIEPAAIGGSVLDELVTADIADQIRELAEGFAAPVRTAFRLRIEGGMRWDEIGRVLQTNPDTVRNWFRRMCHSIEERLSEEM